VITAPVHPARHRNFLTGELFVDMSAVM